MNALNFIVGSLAVWRLSHALVKENGPLMIFARLRARLGRTQRRSGGFFDLITCVYCISFWIGLLAALYNVNDIGPWFAYGFAYSAVSMLLEVMFNKLGSK